MYTVYWLHYCDQNDPTTQGYVGITGRNAIQRFNDHKNNAKNPHLMHRVRSGDTILSILHHGLLKEEAQRIEKELRPTANIGWNIAVGGDVPPPRSKENVAGTKVCLSGDDRTDAQKARAKAHSERMKGRTPWNAGKDLGGKHYLKKGTALVTQMTVERNSTQLTCPKCGKIGAGPIMKRWHFENCKS